MSMEPRFPAYAKRVQEARKLTAYIEAVRKLVESDNKVFSCLTSIIVDYQDGRTAEALAESIREHG